MAVGEDVRQTQIRKLLLDRLDERFPDPMLKIELLVLLSLLHTRVPANRAHIDHAISELHERPSLDRYIQISDVSENEVDELLVHVFAQPLDEGVRRERDAHTDRGETVLGEAEVEEGRDGYGGGAELFLLFGEVGAADEADGDFVSQGGEELEHFGGDGLCREVLAIRLDGLCGCCLHVLLA